MNIFQSMRKEAGISQAMLADRVGVERSTVAKWETGTSLPRADLLPKLADVLGCTVDELLRQPEQKETPA